MEFTTTERGNRQLIKDGYIYVFKTTQHLAGHRPPAQRRHYLDCNRRILTTVDDYTNRQTIPYLRSIAHNLGF